MASSVLFDTNTTLPTAILDAATLSVRATLGSFLHQQPTPAAAGLFEASEACIIGIISLLGQEKWSVSLIFPRDCATEVVEQFCGYRIEFDEPDMGDAIGELLNVLAGFMVDELEKRSRPSRMSLPTVLRGSSVEFLSERTRASTTIGFQTRFGWFNLRVAGAGSSLCIRLPGQ